MTRVGVRELRQRASELLRRVQSGESFEVTDRGRPVAHLGPIKDRRPLDLMRDSGSLEPRKRDLDDLPPPLKPPKGSALPSRVLQRLRRDER